MAVPISLRQFVTDLLNNSLGAAEENMTTVSNVVDEGVILQGLDAQKCDLIEMIIHKVISNSRNGEIYISSEFTQNRLELRVTDRNNFNGYGLSFSMGSIAVHANRAGAWLQLINPRQREASIVLSFPGEKAA